MRFRDFRISNDRMLLYLFNATLRILNCVLNMICIFFTFFSFIFDNEVEICNSGKWTAMSKLRLYCGLFTLTNVGIVFMLIDRIRFWWQKKCLHYRFRFPYFSCLWFLIITFHDYRLLTIATFVLLTVFYFHTIC